MTANRRLSAGAKPRNRKAPTLRQLGGLQRWAEELARGVRTPVSYDALWRAACWEAAALEAEAADSRRVAVDLMKRARDVLAADLEVAS